MLHFTGFLLSPAPPDNPAISYGVTSPSLWWKCHLKTIWCYQIQFSFPESTYTSSSELCIMPGYTFQRRSCANISLLKRSGGEQHTELLYCLDTETRSRFPKGLKRPPTTAASSMSLHCQLSQVFNRLKGLKISAKPESTEGTLSP